MNAIRRNITERDLANARRLKRIWDHRRQELELTQQKLADRWKIRQSTISQYLNGVIALNTDSILKFAEALGADPREIDPDLLLPAKSGVGRAPATRLPVLLAYSADRNTSGMPRFGDVQAEQDVQGCVLLYMNAPFEPARLSVGDFVLLDPFAEPRIGAMVLALLRQQGNFRLQLARLHRRERTTTWLDQWDDDPYRVPARALVRVTSARPAVVSGVD